MAKMDGVIIPEHAMSFEAQQSQQEEIHASQSPPPYEMVLSIVSHVYKSVTHVRSL
jgi:condensin-2 complex subunit H2